MRSYIARTERPALFRKRNRKLIPGFHPAEKAGWEVGHQDRRGTEMNLNTVDRLWGDFLNSFVKNAPPKSPPTPAQIDSYKACFYAGAWSLCATLCQHSPTWNMNEWFRTLRKELEATINEKADGEFVRNEGWKQ
jgi:hypothetical protein